MLYFIWWRKEMEKKHDIIIVPRPKFVCPLGGPLSLPPLSFFHFDSIGNLIIEAVFFAGAIY